MDESICSGGLRTQMWHTETSLLKKTISITKYNLCKSGVCVTEPLIKEKAPSSLLQAYFTSHLSPLPRLYNCFSYRKSRSTGPRHQPAKRKTQAVSRNKKKYLMVTLFLLE